MRAYFDLREFVFHIVRVHSFDLLTSRSSENLDDLDKLIDTDD